MGDGVLEMLSASGSAKAHEAIAAAAGADMGAVFGRMPSVSHHLDDPL